MARTVLIVEDSDTSADTLEIALLSLPDVSIAHAASGRKAWQLIQNQVVAAIVTDLHMPHMDGFELIERVRAAGGAAHIPIIVISGDSDPGTPEKVAVLILRAMDRQGLWHPQDAPALEQVQVLSATA